MKKINDLRRLAQAQVVLVFFTLLFSLLAFSGMNVFDTNGVLPYPSDNMVFITKNSGVVDTDKFYKELTQLADTEHLTIIKNVLTDDGALKGYVFGETKQIFENSNIYTRDKTLLKTTTIEGNYYFVGKVTTKIKQVFKNQNLEFEIFNTPIWLVAISFLTGGNLYALSFFVLLLMFFVVTYALLVSRLKEAVIERSFGIFQIKNMKRFLKSILTIMISSTFFGLVISLENVYFGTVKLKAYFLTLGMMILLMILLQAIAYLIFRWQVTRANISDIQKNKLSGKKIQVIWLLVMALSTVLLTHETAVIVKNYPKYLAQRNLVKKWQPAENYVRIWWSFLDNGNSQGNLTEKNEEMQQDIQNTRQFSDSFSNDEILVSRLTNEQVSWSGEVGVYVEGEGLKLKKVNPKLAENIYTVNPQVLKLNQKIHPQSYYKAKTDKAVTVFIPEKYRSGLEDIKLIVLNGISEVVPEEEVNWQFVPNQQEIFLFMLESSSSISLPDSDKTDAILVDLDWGKLPQNERTNFIMGEFTFDAMYDARGLQRKLDDSHLIRKVNHFQNVKMSLENIVNDLNRQFVSSISLISVMFFLQLLVIYNFLKLQIQLNSKQIIICTLNGLGFNRTIFKYFLSLLLTLSLAEVLCWFWLGDEMIALILLAVYILSILMIYLGAFYRLRQNKLSILKGGDIT